MRISLKKPIFLIFIVLIIGLVILGSYFFVKNPLSGRRNSVTPERPTSSFLNLNCGRPLFPRAENTYKKEGNRYVVEPAKCCGDLAFVSVNAVSSVSDVYETETISEVYEIEEAKGDLSRRNILIQVEIPHGRLIFRTDIFNEKLIGAEKKPESGFRCVSPGLRIIDSSIISTIPVEAGSQSINKPNRYEVSLYVDDNHEIVNIEKLEIKKLPDNSQKHQIQTETLARKLKLAEGGDCLGLFGYIYNYNNYSSFDREGGLDYRVFDTRGGDPGANGVSPQVTVVRNDLDEPQGFFYDLSFIDIVPFEVEWKDKGFVIKAKRESDDLCENWYTFQRHPYDEVYFKVNFNKQTNNLEIEEEIIGSYRPCQ